MTESEKLCLSCGLCCDGTLFGRVSLKPGDSPSHLSARGLVILGNEGQHFFDQPCSAFERPCCRIYADRPINCREYRCALLKRYESGEVSWTDAQDKVGRVRGIEARIATELARVLPGRRFTSTGEVLQLVPTDDELDANPELRRAWAPVMMWLSVLLDCVQSHFQSRPATASSQRA